MKFNEFYKLYISGDLKIEYITKTETKIYFAEDATLINSSKKYLVDFTYGFRYYSNKLGVYKNLI